MTAGRIKSLVIALACGVLVLSGTEARADLSQSQARKALTRIPGLEIKSSAVRVKSVSAGTASAAEASADLKTVFKFEADKEGRWRVAEVRTGQERWESIDTIAVALKAQTNTRDCNAPEPFIRGKVPTDPSVKRARCLLASLLGVNLPSDAVRIQTVDVLPIPFASQPSVTVTALVRVEARLVKDKSGWRVTDLRTGDRDWVALDALVAALNQEKQKQAQAELALMAKALEKFRRDRGTFIVSDSQGVAIDFLSPRYLARVIRLDPWNKPYKYLGERDHFTLRSTGPDGKDQTSDDILLEGTGRQ